jgi:hypothetical protein
MIKFHFKNEYNYFAKEGVFKYKDEIKRRALGLLKKYGLYVDEEEEEFDLHLDDIV